MPHLQTQDTTFAQPPVCGFQACRSLPSTEKRWTHRSQHSAAATCTPDSKTHMQSARPSWVSELMRKQGCGRPAAAQLPKPCSSPSLLPSAPNRASMPATHKHSSRAHTSAQQQPAKKLHRPAAKIACQHGCAAAHSLSLQPPLQRMQLAAQRQTRLTKIHQP